MNLSKPIAAISRKPQTKTPNWMTKPSAHGSASASSLSSISESKDSSTAEPTSPPLVVEDTEPDSVSDVKKKTATGHSDSSLFKKPSKSFAKVDPEPLPKESTLTVRKLDLASRDFSDLSPLLVETNPFSTWIAEVLEFLSDDASFRLLEDAFRLSLPINYGKYLLSNRSNSDLILGICRLDECNPDYFQSQDSLDTFRLLGDTIGFEHFFVNLCELKGYYNTDGEDESVKYYHLRHFHFALFILLVKSENAPKSVASFTSIVTNYVFRGLLPKSSRGSRLNRRGDTYFFSFKFDVTPFRRAEERGVEILAMRMISWVCQKTDEDLKTPTRITRTPISEHCYSVENVKPFSLRSYVEFVSNSRSFGLITKEALDPLLEKMDVDGFFLLPRDGAEFINKDRYFFMEFDVYEYPYKSESFWAYECTPGKLYATHGSYYVPAYSCFSLALSFSRTVNSSGNVEFDNTYEDVIIQRFNNPNAVRPTRMKECFESLIPENGVVSPNNAFAFMDAAYKKHLFAAARDEPTWFKTYSFGQTGKDGTSTGVRFRPYRQFNSRPSRGRSRYGRR